jgi:exodeoxyribonuclease VII large subunit
MAAAVRYRLEREEAGLAAIRSRPVLADPGRVLTARADDVSAVLERARRHLRHSIDRAAVDIEHTRARVRALSPAATLERGYAVVQRLDGAVVRQPEEVDVGDRIRVRLANGELAATVEPPAGTGLH